MPGSKLREIVVRLLDEADEPDPHVLAEKVLQELSVYDLEDALRQTLPQYVRVMAHRDRPSIQRIQKMGQRRDKHPEGWSPWVEAVQRGDLRKSRWSVKGGWKFLDQLTVPDLEELVASAEKLEGAARAKKQAFGLLLFAMSVRGVQKVGDLNDAQIANALAGVEVPE